MKKKKILFLINTLSGGGAEKVLINTVNNIDKSKFDITVQTIYNDGVYIDDLGKSIIYKKVVKNPHGRFGAFYTSVINKIIIKVNSGILHKLFIHKKYDCEVAFLEGAPNKIISGANKKQKTISWIHSDFLTNHDSEVFFGNREKEEKSYHSFNKIIFVSKCCKDSFNDKYKGLQEKTKVIYNPIDIKQIRLMSEEKIDDIQKDGFTICSIGRLNSQKAYERLVNMHVKLLKDNIKNKVWIIGEGEEHKNLDDIIKEQNVKHTFKILGFKNNPYRYLAQSDLFVCSSKSESFSLAVCEAAILNIPIVSTDCAGPREILEYGKYGIISKNDEQDLYEKVKKMIIDKNLYNNFKESSRTCLEDKVNLNKIVTEIENILLEVINE